MRINVATLFPEFFDSPLKASIIGRAAKAGAVEFNIVDIRSFSRDKHKKCDDVPYGGGAGMVMTPEPLDRCLADIKRHDKKTRVVFLSPAGDAFNQERAGRFAQAESVTLVCGHYEGIDNRIIEREADEVISVGDFVLSGGETAALVVIDAVVRLLPGAVGNEQSVETESFCDGLLEYAQYTRPREYKGRVVPDALCGGNHAEIARWRRKDSLRRTFERRPDLLQRINLSDDDKTLITDTILERGKHNG